MSAKAVAEQTARQILAACGVGRAHAVGAGSERLAQAWLTMGVPASCGPLTEPLPHRMRILAVLSGLEDLATKDVDALLVSWRHVVGSAFLRFPATTDRPRGWWEERLFRQGWRKHPSYFDHADYEALENETGSICVVLEAIPGPAAVDYPLPWLLAERTLHMDMMRETGRRSDAHIFRYALAARFVQTGDSVIDAACGYGYGAHLMAHHSAAAKVLGIDLSERCIAYAEAAYGRPGRLAFRQGDVAALAFLPDNSADLIASFETLEHIPDPAGFIAEVHRILRPGGRFIASVPNQWVDETGRDPNPHHLHVYDWPRLQGEVSRHFLLEQAWSQVAGGALKLPDRPRRITPFDPAGELMIEAEWLLVMGMKSPLEGRGVPFVDTLHATQPDPSANVTAFARDYRNPWLVRGAVSIGARLISPAPREVVLRVVAADEDARDSADRGAALCVLAYDSLAVEVIDLDLVEPVLADIDGYLALAPTNPTILRWQVSSSFVQGLLLARLGRLDAAEAAWTQCIGLDAAAFSPILLTKTLEARQRLALLATSRGEIAKARVLLVDGLQQLETSFAGGLRASVGNPGHPNSFGFKEAAHVFAMAQRAAIALRYLDLKGELPGFAFARMYESDPVALNATLREHLAAYDKTVHSWYVPHIQRLEQGLGDAYKRIAELEAELRHRQDTATPRPPSEPQPPEPESTNK